MALWMPPGSACSFFVHMCGCIFLGSAPVRASNFGRPRSTASALPHSTLTNNGRATTALSARLSDRDRRSAAFHGHQEEPEDHQVDPTGPLLYDGTYRRLTNTSGAQNIQQANTSSSSQVHLPPIAANATETPSPAASRHANHLPPVDHSSSVTRGHQQIDPAQPLPQSHQQEAWETPYHHLSLAPLSLDQIRPVIVLDLRPLQAFLDVRIAGSVNLALPSLVVRRMKRTVSSSAALASPSASAMSSQLSPLSHLMTYVTTAPGKRKFQSLLDAIPPMGDDARSNEQDSSGSSPLKLWRADVVIVFDKPDASSSNKPSPSMASPQATPPSPASLNWPKSASLEASQTLGAAIQRLHPGDTTRTRDYSVRGSVRLLDQDLRLLASRPGFAKWIEKGTEEEPEDSAASACGDASNAVGTAGDTGSPALPPIVTDLTPASVKPNANSSQGLPLLDAPRASNVAPMGPPTTDVCGAASAPAPSSCAPTQPPKRPGRPSLARLDTSEKVKTLGSSPSQAGASRQRSATAGSPRHGGSSRKPSPGKATMTPPSAKPTSSMSLQNVARLQSQLPPSPASFSEMSLPFAGAAHPTRLSNAALQVPLSQAQADRELARRGSVPSEDDAPMFDANGGEPSPMSSNFSSKPPNQPIVSFDVSTVIPSFLFLGPDITTEDEVRELEARGVRRILNCAAELPDRGVRGDHASQLYLGHRFDRYLKIPMWDNVEAKGVQEDMEQACAFLDDARLHDSPVYVHCRAGKSRSVSVVMAYLIHAHRWTLKHAYAYVAEKRPDISPNIGFVSCLMAFEDMTLNRKGQPKSIQSEKSPSAADPRKPGGVRNEELAANKPARQSMPTIDSLFQTQSRQENNFSRTSSLGGQHLDFHTDTIADSSLAGHLATGEADSPSNHALPFGSTTQFSTEHKGRDGRYRAFRGPAVDLEAKVNSPTDSVLRLNSPSADDSPTSSEGPTISGEHESGARNRTNGVHNAYAPCRRATMAGLGSLMDRRRSGRETPTE